MPSLFPFSSSSGSVVCACSFSSGINFCYHSILLVFSSINYFPTYSIPSAMICQPHIQHRSFQSLHPSGPLTFLHISPIFLLPFLSSSLRPFPHLVNLLLLFIPLLLLLLHHLHRLESIAFV